MKEIRKVSTPPEWAEWGWPARIGYVVVFVAIMVPVIWVAQKIGLFVRGLLG